MSTEAGYVDAMYRAANSRSDHGDKLDLLKNNRIRKYPCVRPHLPRVDKAVCAVCVMHCGKHHTAPISCLHSAYYNLLSAFSSCSYPLQALLSLQDVFMPDI